MSDKDEDLFGSDADLDDVIGDAKPATATRNDEEEDLFGSDDEPEPVAEQDLGTKASRFNTGRTATQKLLGPAKVVFKPQDSIRISSPGVEMCTMKLPSWLSAETAEFNPDVVRKTFTGEDDSTQLVHKIRWRMTTDELGHKFRESNARLVNWSDGSTQLLVGALVFDVVRTPLPKNLHFLYDQNDVLQQYRTSFTTKLLVKPNHQVPSHVRKRPKVVQTPVQTTKKIYTMKDPEQEVEEKIKRQRLQDSQERARERVTKWVPPPESFSADFLEYSEDDESSDESPPHRRIGEAESAQRLQAAKVSDRIVKGKAVIKQKEKKVQAPVPEEPTAISDDEDDEVEVRYKSGAGVKRRHVIQESDSD